MATIKLNKSVDSAAEVGRTVVIEACCQVRKIGGEEEALDVAAGALSAAVATIALSLGAESGRRVLDTAFESGLAAIKAHGVNTSGVH